MRRRRATRWFIGWHLAGLVVASGAAVGGWLGIIIAIVKGAVS